MPQVPVDDIELDTNGRQQLAHSGVQFPPEAVPLALDLAHGAPSRAAPVRFRQFPKTRLDTFETPQPVQQVLLDPNENQARLPRAGLDRERPVGIVPEGAGLCCCRA
jgi:hypothetical protein